MSFKFKIAIGDWSGDGHGINEYFKIKSNKSVEEVREAYFKAIQILGKDYPKEICQEYEDDYVSEYDQEELEELGFVFTHYHENTLGLVYPTAKGMLELTLWFLKQGDPDLILKQEEEVPTLHFYGFDDKERHIGFIGYGLFN